MLGIDQMRECILIFLNSAGYSGMWNISDKEDTHLSTRIKVYKVKYINRDPLIVPPAAAFYIIEGWVMNGYDDERLNPAEIGLLDLKGAITKHACVNSLADLQTYLDKHFPSGSALTAKLASNKAALSPAADAYKSVAEQCVDDSFIVALISSVSNKIRARPLYSNPDLESAVIACINQKVRAHVRGHL